MGSIDKACIAGFLCRLCSEMHRTVIHIYGEQGLRHGLLEKINGYLPVTITPTDPLPKTICESCLRRVEEHYDLLMRIRKRRDLLKLTERALERSAAESFAEDVVATTTTTAPSAASSSSDGDDQSEDN